MNEATDHHSMLAVRDGDLDKLGYLFEKYHRRLFNLFLRLVGNRDASEDLVQEVFWRMLKYRHTYRGEGKFATWMYSIAHNVKADYFRKARHRQNETHEVDDLASPHPTPAERSESTRRAAALHRALGRLSTEKREALVMSRFHNLKYEEISTILDCPVGTIKARVFYAMQELRSHFRQQIREATR